MCHLKYALKAFLITYADYLLFAGAVATKSLALCLAYTWNRNLDGKDETRDDVTPDENPGAAVVTLLDSGQTDLALVPMQDLADVFGQSPQSFHEPL
jgi:hypothetical protein